MLKFLNLNYYVALNGYKSYIGGVANCSKKKHLTTRIITKWSNNSFKWI